jgi:exodeoxyribonuclease VII large subunit
VGAPEPTLGAHIFSVTELIGGLKLLLEDRVGRVWVVGEISNLRRAGSGHCYFTLKDDAAQVRAVLFRGAARGLAFDPEEGLEVLLYGELGLYEARGELQLVVRHLEPRGRGALQLAIEQLRARLDAEGLFDPARKRALPRHPRRVGVVTSPAGAAVRDVIQVSGRRHPGIPLLIAPTRVQGEGAEAEIAAALERIARQPGVDVVLLVRGGGSLEDFLPFNTEAVVRALCACPVPVVTGVGHEVDVCLADLAADARAPTPSAAAALVLPDREEMRERVGVAGARLRVAMQRLLGHLRGRLAHRQEAMLGRSPAARLATQRAHLEAARRALLPAVGRRIERARASLAGAAGRLDSLSPLAVLGRGYAIVRRERDAAIVRRAAEVAPGDALLIRVAEGEIAASVRAARPPAED